MSFVVWVRNFRNNTACTGTIVSDRSVLTAAHCAEYPTTPQEMGVHTFGSQDDDYLSVSSVYIHPQYDPSSYSDTPDVAILRLDDSVTLWGGRAVALDDGTHWTDQVPLPQSAYAMGFGITESSGGRPTHPDLYCTNMRLPTTSECEDTGWSLTANHGCAGGGGYDGCSGDSGGPLLLAHSGVFVQAGVTSYGTVDCGPIPSVFVRTSPASVRDFVEGIDPSVTYTTLTPPSDSCDCATPEHECMSNGFSVDARCGCDFHEVSDVAFCYVVGAACPDATGSRVIVGALWRFCTPAPATARQDPHLVFAHGGGADFRGRDGAYWNFFSSPNVSLAMRTTAVDFRLRPTLLVHGTFLTGAYFSLRASTGRRFDLDFEVERLNERGYGWTAVRGRCAKVGSEGARFAFGLHGTRSCDDLHAFMNYSTLTVVSREWNVSVTSRPVYGRVGARGTAHRLDVRVSPRGAWSVPPHGILGQSYGRSRRDGRVDVYPESGEFTTSAMAEGALDGEASDYELAAPFDTTWRYSRFDDVRAPCVNCNATASNLTSGAVG